MCDLAPDKDRMQHPWKNKISDKLPLPSEQAAILAPWHGTSNEAARLACHLLCPRKLCTLTIAPRLFGSAHNPKGGRFWRSDVEKMWYAEFPMANRKPPYFDASSDPLVARRNGYRVCGDCLTASKLLIGIGMLIGSGMLITRDFSEDSTSRPNGLADTTDLGSGDGTPSLNRGACRNCGGRF